ncbi:hypothetical protein BDA96_03G384300 [Sorghum bicolor]|uniref:Uncharacterized protein n=1 Tax=Sorghum bicolor TaxID=4558 RepID=A0A921RHZ3_SORBI|nr:hypothetical protein BDA96_03G384300 [Sorghum bicolor]
MGRPRSSRRRLVASSRGTRSLPVGRIVGCARQHFAFPRTQALQILMVCGEQGNLVKTEGEVFVLHDSNA